ncbi:MAG: hypothetical protein FWG05_01785, partial [Kiritimatiellaeota bacterium]|nr:hypothetical protein [Kiritimatiellota bacterium]
MRAKSQLTTAVCIAILPVLTVFSQTFTDPPSVNPRVGTFTGDDDCGITPLKTYTHKLNFGLDNAAAWQSPVFNPVSVNGVLFETVDYYTPPFDELPGATPLPGGLNYSGTWGGVSHGYDHNTPVDAHTDVDPSSDVFKLIYGYVTVYSDGWQHFLGDYRWFDGPGLVKLTGLEPGRKYEIRIYSRPGWCDGNIRDMQITFDDGSGNTSTLSGFKQGHCTLNIYGHHEGHVLLPADVITFRYVATGNGELIFTTSGGNIIPAVSNELIGYLNVENGNETGVSANGATINGTAHPEGETSHITAYWGFAPGAWEGFVEDPGNPYSTETPFAIPLTGLPSGTEIFYGVQMTNAWNEIWSETKSFFTDSAPGAPSFASSKPDISVFSDGVKMLMKIAPTAEDYNVTVTLLTGADSSSFSETQVWNNIPPETPWDCEYITSWAPNTAFWYQLIASNDNGVVSTTPASVMIQNRNPEWKVNNPNPGDWNISAENFNFGGSSTAFTMGDSATFNPTYHYDNTVTLTHDLDADTIVFNPASEHYGSYRYTVEAPASESIWLWKKLDFITLRANEHQWGYEGFLDMITPKISGPGAVNVTRGGILTLGNPANDFEGGVSVLQGELRTTLTEPSGTPFGRGDFVFGTDATLIRQPVWVEIANADSDPRTLANAGSAALISGPQNTTRLTLGENVTAQLKEITQDNGGSFQVEFNAGAELLFSEMPECDLPPWFVINSAPPTYAAIESGAVIPAATTNIHESTDADYADINDNPTLSAPANARGLIMNSHINLDGKALTLGTYDGKAGIIMPGHWWSENRTVSGGAIDTGANDLHVFARGDSTLIADISGTGAAYFSGNDIAWQGSEIPSGGLYVQQSTLNFYLLDDFTLRGPVGGAGTLRKFMPGKLTVESTGSALMKLDVRQGEVEFIGGTHAIQRLFVNDNGNTGIISANGATVNLLPFHGTYDRVTCFIGANNPGAAFYATNNALVTCANQMIIGSGGDANDSLMLVENSVFTTENEVRIGDSVSRNKLVIDNGEATINKVNIGRLSTASENALVIRDSNVTIGPNN